MLLLCLITLARAMDPETVHLLTPLADFGERCGYEGCPATKEDHTNVHIVPHSHAELGHIRTFHHHYTGDDGVHQSNVNMKRILDATISELWANHERKFTLSDSELPYLFHWWSKREGTVRRMVYELIRQGRLVVVGGGWGMPDEATTSYQAIIDSYTYSLRKINATFLSCARPLVAWQADVFGHSREYASLVAQMGFDGLFINPISIDDEMIRMERRALEFVWRGSDDLGAETDLYTHKLFDGYWSPPGFCFGSLCSDPLMISSDSVLNNIDERVSQFIEAVRYRQLPHYTTNHILVVMGQRFGFFTAKMWFDNIDKLIGEVNRKASKDGLKIHVTYSTPACYLQAVHNENPILETKQDDFFPCAYDKHSYMSGLFTTRPAFKYLIREANVYLQMAKQLQVLARLGNNDALLENFMWLGGVIQDHNIITGGLMEHVMNYYTEKVHHAVDRSLGLLGQALRSHGHQGVKYHRCALNESSCRYTGGDSFNVILYNPLAWQVRHAVRLPVMNQDYSVFDPKGEKISAFTIALPDPVLKMSNGKTHELVFFADLPALGFRSYYVQTHPRTARSILKKISGPRQRYFTRQADHNRTVLDVLEEDDDPSLRVIAQSSPRPIERTDKTMDTTEAKMDNTSEHNDDNQDEYVTNRNEDFIDHEENEEAAKTSQESYRKNNYYNIPSKDKFIKNQYIQINLDEYNKETNIQLANGINTSLDIQYYYYVSDDPQKLQADRKKPGAYIFRPMDSNPVPIIDVIDTRVYKTDIVEEIHTIYSTYASFSLKLYKDSPTVQVDWVLEAIPVEDELGKEVFIRYTTDLVNDGVFYTDANGRQSIKRIKNARGLYEPYNLDPVAGNYYPVTSRIYLEDLKRNIRLSIFNDRAQGGTSILEGTIDLMLQRRIFTDDAGFEAGLNGTDKDRIRGTHYLYLTKANYKPNRVFEKKFAKEIELHPLIIIANDKKMVKEKWLTLKNEFSAFKSKLPTGVHVLTIQEWNEKTLLLRVENYLEKIDVVRNGTKRVRIKDLFANIKIKKLKETTLAANLGIEDWTPLRWRLKDKFVKNFNDFYGSGKIDYRNVEDLKPIEDVNLSDGVILVPQQIRTFVVWYDYIK